MMLDCSSSSGKTVLLIQTASHSTMTEINHSEFSQCIHCFYKAAKQSVASFWLQDLRGISRAMRPSTSLSRATQASPFPCPVRWPLYSLVDGDLKKRDKKNLISNQKFISDLLKSDLAFTYCVLQMKRSRADVLPCYIASIASPNFQRKREQERHRQHYLPGSQ